MLSAFLDEMAARPFADGASDCVMTVADWVVLNGHPDPAAPWRGRYRTALGRARLLNRLGGLEAALCAGAARAGLEATDAPGPGDVGLIESGGQGYAAICLGERWAIKGRGLEVAPAEVVRRAWRI